MKNNPLPHLSYKSVFCFSLLITTQILSGVGWGGVGEEKPRKIKKRFNAPKNQNMGAGMGNMTSSLLNQLTAGF